MSIMLGHISDEVLIWNAHGGDGSYIAFHDTRQGYLRPDGTGGLAVGPPVDLQLYETLDDAAFRRWVEETHIAHSRAGNLRPADILDNLDRGRYRAQCMLSCDLVVKGMGRRGRGRVEFPHKHSIPGVLARMFPKVPVIGFTGAVNLGTSSNSDGTRFAPTIAVRHETAARSFHVSKAGTVLDATIKLPVSGELIDEMTPLLPGVAVYRRKGTPPSNDQVDAFQRWVDGDAPLYRDVAGPFARPNLNALTPAVFPAADVLVGRLRRDCPETAAGVDDWVGDHTPSAVRRACGYAAGVEDRAANAFFDRTGWVAPWRWPGVMVEGILNAAETGSMLYGRDDLKDGT